MWLAWRDKGILPRPGGWYSQPIRLIALFTGLDLVYETWTYYRSKDMSLDKLTPTQKALIKWIEADD